MENNNHENRITSLENQVSELRYVLGKNSVLLEKAIESYEKFSLAIDKFSETLTNVQISFEKMNLRTELMEEEVAELDTSLKEQKKESSSQISTIKRDVEILQKRGTIDIISLITENTYKIIGIILLSVIFYLIFGVDLSLIK